MQKLESLRKEILQKINDDVESELLATSSSYIRVYDGMYGKYTNFRIKPHTRTTLSHKIEIGPDVAPRGMHQDIKTGLADYMLQLPPETLLILNRVYLFNTTKDVQVLTKRHGIDMEELPDALWDENMELNPNFVGFHWFMDDSVILNMNALYKTALELANGDPDQTREEMRIGVYTTLTHELRHLMLSDTNYDFSWLEGQDETEDGVEQWALNMFEDITHHPLSGSQLYRYEIIGPDGQKYGLFNGLNHTGMPESKIQHLIRPINAYMPFYHAKTHENRPIYWFTEYGHEAFKADINAIGKAIGEYGWKLEEKNAKLNYRGNNVYYYDRCQILTTQRS